MAAFGSTDVRDDLPKVSVPTLVLHGDADATVPFEGSGNRIHAAVPEANWPSRRGSARVQRQARR